MRVTSSRTLRSRRVEVEQQIDHHLAGAVIGDLAAAIDLDQRDAVIAQQVFRLAGLAERIDRRVFADPQFVGRLVVRVAVKSSIACQVGS
jgi:hypothetical protein